MEILLFIAFIILLVIFDILFYELGYKKGRLDELEENVSMINKALFVNNEPQDPFGDGE